MWTTEEDSVKIIRPLDGAEGGGEQLLAHYLSELDEMEAARRQGMGLAIKVQFMATFTLLLLALASVYLTAVQLPLSQLLLLAGWMAYFTLAVNLLVSLSRLRWVERRVYLRIGLVCTFLSVVLLAYLLRDGAGDFYVLYLIPLITAGMYFGLMAALFTALLSALSYLGVAYLLVPLDPFLLSILVVRSVAFFLLAALVGLSAEGQAHVVERLLDAYGRAQELAMTDSLTGVFSRRFLNAELVRELARVQREQGHGSLVFMDLDGFKNFNDRYGHLVGDAALQRVGETLRRSSRASDLVGRYGGDEFAILLPSSGVEGAQSWADRVRQALAQAFVDWPELSDGAGLSASFGIVPYPELADTADQLFRRADVAVYRAKMEGGNRAVVWEPAWEERAPGELEPS